MLYATDTRTMEGISARGYDYYFIEANYKKEEIKRKIADKKEQGEYAYEVRAMNEHLSQEEAEDFIYSNMTSKSRYIFLHDLKLPFGSAFMSVANVQSPTAWQRGQLLGSYTFR